jgi:hypothetical protein
MTNSRNIGFSHGQNGKGDADRTTNDLAYRANIRLINWGDEPVYFERRGRKLVKTYGVAAPVQEGEKTEHDKCSDRHLWDEICELQKDLKEANRVYSELCESIEAEHKTCELKVHVAYNNGRVAGREEVMRELKKISGHLGGAK